MGSLSSSKQETSIFCSLGLFIAGYIFYSSSLIQPFYALEFKLSSWQTGFVQSLIPLGAIIGAVLAGPLSDLLGRRRLLVWNYLFLATFGLAGLLIFDFYSLCFTRLLNGFLAGTLYPLCAAYLVEMTPNTSLVRQSAILMFTNCLAAPIVSLLTILFTYFCNDYFLWRLIASFHAGIALLMYFWAIKLPESPEWLTCEKNITLANTQTNWRILLENIKTLFTHTHRKTTICLISAWFLMDIAYYGTNFFVPYLLQTMHKTLFVNTATHFSLANEVLYDTLIINIFFMLGAFVAIFIVEKIDLIKLQKYGFLIAGLSFFILANYFYIGLNQNFIIILLFIVFNFALNIGPDVTTYLLSATSYPVEIRASGHGLIAGFAKFGSFLGVLFLPRIQDLCGYEFVIFFLSILLFIAYLFTSYFSKVIQSKQPIKESKIAYETN